MIKKKFFICLVLAVMAIGANAQTTWNVRVGAGTFGIIKDNFDGVSQRFGPALTAECNIPFKLGGSYTFSPSILAALSSGSSDAYTEIVSCLHLGYKTVLSNNVLFFPKIGPMLGYCDNVWDSTCLLGPSAELAFEMKHFVVALNAYIGLIDETQPGGFLSFGYKF